MSEVSVFEIIELDYLKVIPLEYPAVPNGIQLALSGEINTNNAYQFQLRMEKIIAAGYTKILFDCASLNYLSSTGVGSFVNTYKKLNGVNGKMVLLQLPPRVYEVFQLLGFSSFLKCEMIREKAEQFLLDQEKKPEIPKPTSASLPARGSPLSHESVFPLVLRCLKCGKSLKTSKAGRFRCPACQIIIRVDTQGLITAE